MEKKKFYITTTLPYVNNDPHLGFAMEIIRADVVARLKTLQGNDVFFNTGTDEHGVKIFEAAQKAGKSTQEYVDGYAAEFKKLKEKLNLSFTNFIRTTDADHVAAAQAFWKQSLANGDIYKKQYKLKYCNGCELEKTDSELVDGHCELHPHLEIEIREEENYFFRYSNYGQKLLNLYGTRPDFVIPESRFNETKAFVERGLEDFSISRLASKMSWGIPVPDDNTQVMYVWFDALVNYIAAVGWPKDMDSFDGWWNSTGGVVQYCGKDNNRQQAAMWQAMLMSVGIKPSKQIVINGFILGAGGQKMSKSLGNVINPFDVLRDFTDVAHAPEDVLRFIVTHDISSFEDSSVSVESIRESYSANLANGLGNLVSRIMRLAVTHLEKPVEIRSQEFSKEYDEAFEKYDLRLAMHYTMEKARYLDGHIQTTEPFRVVKTDPEKGKAMITELVQQLYHVAFLLTPFLPRTAEAIRMLIKEHKMPEKPLFNRLGATQ